MKTAGRIGEPSRKRLWIWWLVFIALVVLIVLLALSVDSLRKPAESAQPGLYSVSQFIDGDTIAVDMNGSVETIRMIGVDTPETHNPDTPVQCYGQEATDYTKRLIGLDKVRLQADPLNTNRDRYERLLRYVYLTDGTLLEEKIIENGYGFAYTQFPFSKAIQFKAKEVFAKSAGRGLWTACTVTVQANGRAQTNPVQ